MVKSLKIGGMRYLITYVKGLYDNGKLDARISHTQTRIEAEKDMSEQATAQALLHEVVHALFVQIGRNELNEQEGMVDALAYGIYQFIRENPEFVNLVQS